jgi:DHA2 family methylenomycin A resistance protein-like MFS transporter
LWWQPTVAAARIWLSPGGGQPGIHLEWAVNAYTLSFAAVMLRAGAITDTLDAKRAFVAGLLVFTASSAVCAAAGSMLMLNLARLIQGAGSALLLPSELVLATASATDEPMRHRLGWLSPAVIAAAALAVAGLLGFVWAERSSPAPLLPPGVYSDHRFVATAVQGALFNFAFYGLLFAMSLMLQQGRGLSALVSGLLFLPLTGLISIGAVCAAPLAQRIGRPAVLYVG